MCDEWMPSLRLRLSRAEYQQLPRPAAYKYEYLAGTAILSPWPRHFHARLALTACAAAPATPFRLRPLRAEDQEALVDLFAAAFYHVQPFGSLDEPALTGAARQCLQRTF